MDVGSLEGGHVAGVLDFEEFAVGDLVVGLGGGGRGDDVLCADDDEGGDLDVGENVYLIGAVGHGVLGGDDGVGGLRGHEVAEFLWKVRGGGFAEEAGYEGFDEGVGCAGGADGVDGFEAVGGLLGSRLQRGC